MLRDHSGAALVVWQLGRPPLRAGGQGDDGPAVVRDAARVSAHAAVVVRFFEAAAGEDHPGHAAFAEHLDITQLGRGVAVAAADDREKAPHGRGGGGAADDLREVRVAHVVHDDCDGRDAPRAQGAGHGIGSVGESRRGGHHACAGALADRMVAVGVEGARRGGQRNLGLSCHVGQDGKAADRRRRPPVGGPDRDRRSLSRHRQLHADRNGNGFP